MDELKNALLELVNGAVEITEDTKALGCPFEECFPALVSRIATIDGKDYGISMEIKVKEL